MKKLPYILISSLAFLLVVVTGTSAVTHDDRVPTEVPPTTPSNQAEEGLNRACEAVETSIQTRNDNIVLFAETILEKFDNISIRVQEYYTEMVVPRGYAVDNYNALLGEIEEKRADVLAALDDAAVTADEFDCNLEDPKGSLTEFKGDVLLLVEALHDYRLAIKDLIVAVNTVVAGQQGAL